MSLPESDGARTEDAGALRLPSQCVIRDAGQLQALLVAQLEQGMPVRLDAGQVERIDTAGLQLLVAFVRDRRKRARAVTWHRCSESLTRAASMLGLSADLELPAGQSAK